MRAAWGRVVSCIGFVMLATISHGQDVREIQAREALRADERLFAYFARFREALASRVGGDPWLTMLKVSENEAEALVHDAAGGAAKHVIFQEGRWIDPVPERRLAPWGRAPSAAAQAFRLSSVDEAQWRAKIKAYRANHPRDFLMGVSVGYFGTPYDRVMVDVQVLSMSGGPSSLTFDMKGEGADVNAAIADVRKAGEAAKQREEAAQASASKRNLLAEMPRLIEDFRRDVGPAKLMAVWVRRQRATLIQADGTMFDYDRRRFVRRAEPYRQSFLCSEGFDDREVDWTALHPLVDRAFRSRGNLGEEDKPFAEITVERPRSHERGCRALEIEVKFTNYRPPWPYVTFDAQGRQLRMR
jgi:hypothetical protein